MSPDGNYVAYTKNNNLYTVNITTKKETALTSDGSEVILNGYASWVYAEEILGRASPIGLSGGAPTVNTLPGLEQMTVKCRCLP